MKFDSEDPRLSSYLLDELSDAERAEVEELLAGDAEARDFVESMRMTTEALQTELAGLDEPALDDLRRARVARAAARGPRTGLVLAGGAIAAAACILLLALGTKSDTADSRSLATRDEPAASSTPVSEQVATATPESADPSNLREGKRQNGLSSTASGVGNTASNRSHDSDRWGAMLGDSGGEGRQQAQQDPVGKANTEPRATGQFALASSRDANERSQSMIPGGAFESSIVDGTTGAGYGHGYIDARGRLGPAQDYRYYAPAIDNVFVDVATDPLSTFSSDVDTASYSQVRRYLRGGSLPPPTMVRIEELINYFSYDYPSPKGDEPFAIATEVAHAPWAPAHKLVRIGIKARDVAQQQRQRANLVFLLDVSGSMRSDDKLPLLKKSFEMLMSKLDKEDRIAIVVYAGASGLALPSTPVSDKKVIERALRRLQSGGSTNGGAGIELAYQVAAANFVEGGVNRVILATDGDFNVGTSSRDELVTLIEQKAKSQVFLTVLGVGMSTAGDGTMEQLADKGNGNYAYIDTLAEAKKVLVDQLHGTLVTIAKDVKLQVEFNPRRVASYRLIGYENRVLANEDFNDDTKDAGDIGAGHTVTALYEIVPPGTGKVDALRYQPGLATQSAAESDELLTVKLRYKEPGDSSSLRTEQPVYDVETDFASATADFKFASAVAAFGMVLRNSEYRGSASLAMILEWAQAGRSRDAHEYRAEFIQLVRRAASLRR